MYYQDSGSDCLVETTTHVYSKKEKLGVGASCEVYRGVEKDTGTNHALKVFKTEAWSKSYESRREVEALTKLKHPNIVAFFGREREISTGRTVLVMEFCQGGSLLSYLQEPENLRGIGDKEFLLFLTNICSGLKHLRLMGFVHRDIKPGNILRAILFDGTVVYKISDFGSSKNIKNDEGEFLSLAGTEEYLHPAIYLKAFVKSDLNCSFNSTVDLWSLGCTIYHACTGDIPFKPYGGVRYNRNAMYIMITCKPSGAISGSQPQKQTDVHWQDKLPHSCQISQSLRGSVERLIAGLIEADKTKQWNFQTFEQAVTDLNRLKKVRVVNSSDASLHDIYFSPSTNFKTFISCIENQTGIESSSFMLLHKTNELSNESDFSLDALAANDSAAVILIHTSNGRRVLPHQSDPYPSFASSVSLEKEIQTALESVWAVFNLDKRIKSQEFVRNTLSEAEKVLSSVCKEKHRQITHQHRQLLEISQYKRSQLEMIGEWEKFRSKLSSCKDVSLSQTEREAKILCLQIHNELFSVQDEIKMNTMKSKEGSCLQKFVGENADANGLENTDLPSRADHLFAEGKSVWQRMKRRRELKHLSHLEDVMHRKDKKDIEEICAYAVHLWQDFSVPKTQKVYDHFIECKMNHFNKNDDLKKIEQQLSTIKSKLRNLDDKITWIRAFSGKMWSELTETVHTSTRNSQLTSMTLKENEELKKKLTTVLNEMTTEVMKLETS